MSREIKFRALTDTGRKWKYGLFSNYRKMPLDNGYAYINTRDGHEWICDFKTLGQYTGLHDKNGKEIYEGDIVKCIHSKYDKAEDMITFMPEPKKYERNYVVEFVNVGSHCGYRLRNKNIHFALTSNIIYNHDIEIIGNVYENPELLEV